MLTPREHKDYVMEIIEKLFGDWAEWCEEKGIL